MASLLILAAQLLLYHKSMLSQAMPQAEDISYSQLMTDLKGIDYEIQFRDQHIEVALGWCATYEEGFGMALIQCPYFLRRGHYITSDGYYQLPDNVSQLNDYMCGPMNRRGRVCMHCIDGFGPSYTSLGYECSNCTGRWYGVPLYLLVELGPSTLFFLIILSFQINLTSAPVIGFIWYSQTVLLEATTGRGEPVLRIFYQSESASRGLKVILTLYGMWNLDFIRYLMPPFCISSKIKTLHVVFLGYLSAFYPLCLITLTWFSIRFYGRCTLPVWIRNSAKVSKNRNNGNVDLITVFTSFFILSYGKFIYQSIKLMSCHRMKDTNGTSNNLYVTAIDPTVTCVSAEYWLFAIPTIFILVFCVILPTMLFLLYPIKSFQVCLSKCKLGGQYQIAFSIFMEKFHSCYRDGLDGGRDMRKFSGFYFYLQILIALYYQLSIRRSTLTFRTYQIMLLSSASLLIALFRPYKKAYMNVCESLLLALMAVQYHFISKKHPSDQHTLMFITTLLPVTVFIMLGVYIVTRRVCKVVSKYYQARCCSLILKSCCNWT